MQPDAAPINPDNGQRITRYLGGDCHITFTIIHFPSYFASCR